MRPILLTFPLLLCLGACAEPASTASPSPDPAPAAAGAPQPAPQPAPEPAQDGTVATPDAPTPAASSPASDDEVPARFQGRYASDAAACAAQGQESHLEIQARRIVFYESSGDVVSAQTDGDQVAITAQMVGEGETWQRTSRFRLEDDGKVLVDSEHGMRRVRCAAG